MRRAWLFAFCLLAALGATVPSGPNPGEAAPDFQLQDQSGTPRNLQSLIGPKGLMLVFYRSADW